MIGLPDCALLVEFHYFHQQKKFAYTPKKSAVTPIHARMLAAEIQRYEKRSAEKSHAIPEHLVETFLLYRNYESMTMKRRNDFHLTATEPAADKRLYPFRGEDSLRPTSALLNL